MQSMFDIGQANLEIVFLNIIKIFMYLRFQYKKFSGNKSWTCTLQLLTENIYSKMSFGYSLLLTDIVDKATGSV